MTTKVKARPSLRSPRLPQGRGNVAAGRRAGLIRILTEDFCQPSLLEVDSSAGVIRNVKILGFYSKNGRRYTPEAVRKAARLYEGVNVNVDHPDKKATQPRSSFTRYAWLENVRFDPDPANGGLRGDLHFLLMEGLDGAPAQPDEFQRRVMWAAKNRPTAFGLSHNADGEVVKEDGIDVIKEISEVRSVDLVADPATTRSLCEGTMALTKVTKQQLLEMGYEVDEENPADAPPAEVAGDGADGAGEVEAEDHIFAAFKKLREKDPSAANKLLAMLKAEIDTEEEADGVDGEAEDGDESTEESDGLDGGDREEGDEEEGKGDMAGKQHKIAKGKRAIVEGLCELAGLKPSKELLETLLALPSQSDVIKAIKLYKPAAKITQPKSAPPSPTKKEVTEGRKDKPPVEDEEALWRWMRD